MIGSRSDKKKKDVDVSPVVEEESYFQPNDNYLKSSSSVRNIGPSAVIGSKITLKGELIGEEDLLIEGVVEGAIDLKGHNLTIGTQGTINADAMAKVITVEGKVNGDLFGSERVLIKSTSEVNGNVTAELISIEEGAKFRGSIDMSSKQSSKKDTSSSVSASNQTKNTVSV